MGDTLAEVLATEGHTVGNGMCEKCWREAATLYAGGQGAYESHTDAYHAVLDRVRYETESRRANDKEERTMRPTGEHKPDCPVRQGSPRGCTCHDSPPPIATPQGPSVIFPQGANEDWSFAGGSSTSQQGPTPAFTQEDARHVVAGTINGNVRHHYSPNCGCDRCHNITEKFRALAADRIERSIGEGPDNG